LAEKEPASSSNIKRAPTKREHHEEEVSDIFESQENLDCGRE